RGPRPPPRTPSSVLTRPNRPPTPRNPHTRGDTRAATLPTPRNNHQKITNQNRDHFMRLLAESGLTMQEEPPRWSSPDETQRPEITAFVVT
ncbi:MAG: hypothetical protein ACRDUW_27575, partial [Pseudonocardiaceae bacterium]